MMDPKLLRMYSDILNEMGSKGVQSTQSQKSGGFNWRDPFGLGAKSRQQQQNVAGSKIGAGYAAAAAGTDKLASQQFPTQPAPSQSAMPKTSTKPKPATNSMAARGKVDAMKGSQASASQTDSSSYTGSQTPPAAAAAAQDTGMAAAPAEKGPDAPSTYINPIPTNIAAGGVKPTTQAAAPATDTSSYTSPTGVALGAQAQDSRQSAMPAQQFSAAQEKWLGGADRTDPFILSRMRKAVPDTTAGTGPNLGTGTLGSTPNQPMQENELEEEVDESLDEQLEEAFNDMLRLSGLEKKNLDESKLVSEKAVSKQQQKFMGMVHAMQKGEKIPGASPELKKVAKTMGKKDAKDFAATKHKGLPKKVTEGLNVMLDEEGHTLEHIVNRFKHEAKTFLNTGEMSDKLYDALYDYYVDRGEMPYGIAKAREGDPYTWVAARFEADIDGTVDVKMPMGEIAGDDTLNELARLAGLSESRVDECGDMGMDQRDSMNVSTNMSSDGTKSVTISAQGDKAEELLSMLKLAGMEGGNRPSMLVVSDDEEMMEADRETEYANTPEEEYETVDRIIRQGNDLNREKKQFANMPKAGDNPMATDQMLDEELSALLDSILVKEAEPRRPKGDTGQAEIFTADLGIQPPSPDEGPVGKAPTAAPKAPATPKAPVVAPGIKR